MYFLKVFSTTLDLSSYSFNIFVLRTELQCEQTLPYWFSLSWITSWIFYLGSHFHTVSLMEVCIVHSNLSITFLQPPQLQLYMLFHFWTPLYISFIISMFCLSDFLYWFPVTNFICFCSTFYNFLKLHLTFFWFPTMGTDIINLIFFKYINSVI